MEEEGRGLTGVKYGEGGRLAGDPGGSWGWASVRPAVLR
jgi:hypothetical protein